MSTNDLMIQSNILTPIHLTVQAKHLIRNIDVTAVKNLKCLICCEILNFHANTDKNLERNDKQCWGIYLVSTSFTVVSLLFEAFRYDEFSFLKLHEFSVFEEFLLCLFWFKKYFHQWILEDQRIQLHCLTLK